MDINRDLRVGIWAGGIVDTHRWPLTSAIRMTVSVPCVCRTEGNLTKRHAYVWLRTFHIDFARFRKGHSTQTHFCAWSFTIFSIETITFHDHGPPYTIVTRHLLGTLASVKSEGKDSSPRDGVSQVVKE